MKKINEFCNRTVAKFSFAQVFKTELLFDSYFYGCRFLSAPEFGQELYGRYSRACSKSRYIELLESASGSNLQIVPA